MNDTIKTAVKNLPKNNRLRLFVEEELSFYNCYFNCFTSRIIREKKILEFENPNRIKVTYEFDLNKLEETNNLLFVFLPDTRKNWMKLTWQGKRLTVCSSENVRDAIFRIVESDLKALKTELCYKGTEYEYWKKELWPGHIPCFVEGLFAKEESENGQMVVEFYDSLEKYNPVGFKWGLFDERRYTYEYALESGSSHWIYVKAPAKFQINLTTDDKRAIPINGNDPEIKACRIKSGDETGNVRFNIDVKVPGTLKWWYRMIVILAVAYIVAFGVIAREIICGCKSLSPVFAQVGISLVAAIIATRGWIMNDETVLKRVSYAMTVLAVLILVLLVVMYSIAGFMAN
ncbi:MAG: hypothetical protein K6F78_05260 [Bacteroidaceae bacterium]|nr:hypothetical protein [Bacteroidaceae bacterium]